MEEKLNLITELERSIANLKYHLEQFIKSKYDSEYERLKKDRSQASRYMSIHADFIKQELTGKYVYPIIHNGDDQFESFYRYADFDTPRYITQITEYLDELKKD